MESGKMGKILNFLEERRDAMIELIERLVNIDSGSYYKEGVNACGKIISEELDSLGFVTRFIPERDCGNHLRAERPGKGIRRLFLSAHLDTVFPKGTAARRPFRVSQGFAYGPGVGDIKGGIVQMLFAVKALHELQMDMPPVSVFLTADEETGSVHGRPHIEELARRSSWVIVMEPSSEPESVGVSRWGLGAFHLAIHGRAAHVLRPDLEGVNACRELALKILALESLSDTRRGIKVSVNMAAGGRSRQVTAAAAQAEIDVRVRQKELMDQVEAQLRHVAATPFLPGIRIELEGRMTRPPMMLNRNSEDFFKLAAEVGRELDMELNPIEEYGGSDGCFTSALGVATLDGMGPLCHDMCGDNENIELASLVPRAALLAGIICRLID